jgi:glycosyltransferase involved in cell wall biosynthesis
MIVFVINNLGIGGAQKMVRYVNGLAHKNDCSNKLLSLFGRNNLEPNNDEIQLCPSKSSYFTVLAKFRKWLKRERPEMICAFGTDAIIVSYIASRGLGIKVVGSERNDPGHLPQKWLILTKYIYPKCDGFVFQLKSVSEFYKMKESDTVKVIPNAYFGKQYKEFVFAKDRDNSIACASARIDKQKGLDVLLNAFVSVRQKFPKYQLHIYGKVNHWNELNKMINLLGLSSYVVFKGQTDCLSDDIHSSRCFVLPSRFEGIPNVLIEAMASGVPCVATDCPPGGPRMLTEGGQAGLLCKVEDATDLANTICLLIENDVLCDSLSEKAQTVQYRFSSEMISKQWKDLFSKINEK